MRSRAAESTEAERRAALAQIGLITRGRIDTLLGTSLSQGAVHA